MITRLPLAILLFCATPALAGAGASVAIPEGHSGVLFALGVLGVLIGRYASRRKDDDTRK